MREAYEISISQYFDRVEGCEPLTNGPFEHFYVMLSLYQTRSSYLVTFKFRLFLNFNPYILY